MSASVLANGPFGVGWLMPQALFGVNGVDPLVHALIWSMGINTLLFLGISLITFPSPIERLQGAQFVNVFSHSAAQGPLSSMSVAADDLLVMAQRIMGNKTALALFRRAAEAQGKVDGLPDPTREFVDRLERELAGTVGAATAHAMIGQITDGAAISVEDLIAMADETAQIMEHTVQLEAKSRELSRTARQLRAANEKLTDLSIQKDGFLSQISHELRTPMTSIRSFSEILRESDDLSSRQSKKYASIILEESIRLTRLLDEILDLSVLENGQVAMQSQQGMLSELIERAVSSAVSDKGARPLEVLRDLESEAISLTTDLDRLSQVFINLVSNARKYCDAATPQLRIIVTRQSGGITVDFIDNGAGIAEKHREIVFEKFSRLSDSSAAGSAGLGLAISREILRNLGGVIEYLPGQSGAGFRVTLPV